MDTVIGDETVIGLDVLTAVDVNSWAVAMTSLDLATMLAGSGEASSLFGFEACT